MPRRASSSLHPGLIVAIVALIVALIVGGKMLFRKKPAGFGDAAKLEIGEFLRNGNSLRGSEYVIEGKVDERLRWTTSRGQVISVRVGSGDDVDFIGVEIPPEVGQTNIDIEQRYAFRVKFRQGGIPVATGITRL
jgi:hypothetical protein